MKMYKYFVKEVKSGIVFETNWTSEKIAPGDGKNKFFYSMPTVRTYLKALDNDGESCEIIKVLIKEESL